MINFTPYIKRTTAADIVEGDFFKVVHHLTARDAVRIARTLLENVDDADTFTADEFHAPVTTRIRVKAAAYELEVLNV